MSLELIAQNKTGLGRASDEVEQVLSELDALHSIIDEWSQLESVRAMLDEPLNLSSTFALIAERFEEVDSLARRVLRPE
ncbi:hypothetical protein [uncultured Porticoccus sp.]|jgi:hypothetical protein|uniref:hypothetical protein n=1 Tax=uncultured Porticoccus sp. TaxID=1256050 RepID=UPI0030D79A70|tara:strand:- start:9904 stop:10140 length:237 start_codon:yes stop_codon:yes gene_type:complete